LIILRKLPIPENPEMGFGAILSDGTILLNDEVVEAYNISPQTVKIIAKEVLKEIKRREKEYRKTKKFPSIKNKIVILVDDGLATGFTMLAAIKAVFKHQPKKIIVAVPVSPENTYNRIKNEVDEIICLYIQPGYGPFAVASYYKDFHELTDEEVKSYLKNCF
jgi:putative phosphoribosyl transferase